MKCITTKNFSIILILSLSVLTSSCGGGGGGDSEKASGTSGSNTTSPINLVTANGQVVAQSADVQAMSSIATILIEKNSTRKSTIQYGSLKTPRENRIVSILKYLTFFPKVFAQTEQADNILYPDQCAPLYPTLWVELTPNVAGLTKNLNRTSSEIIGSLNDLGELVNEEIVFIAYDIDIDNDGIADLNISSQDTEELQYINLDTSCDGIPNINIDSDGNGVADTNIDEDGDGVGDYSIVAGDGISISNATVKLIHVETGDTFESTTNQNGEFSIDELRTGQYEIDIRYVSSISGKTLWKLDALYINSSGNIGTFRLDTRPNLLGCKVIQDNNSTLLENDLYGEKSPSCQANLAISDGSTVRLHLSLIDPNNDIVSLSERNFGDVGWAYEVISQSSVANHDTDEQEIILDIRFNEDSYEFVGTNKFRLPWNIADNMPNLDCIYFVEKDVLPGTEPEECPDKVNWSEVEAIHIGFKLDNSDGVGSMDGSADIWFDLKLTNTTYDFSPTAVVNDEIPIINSITINDIVYTNEDSLENQVINLGDISTLNQLDIMIESTADENFPLLNNIHYSLESSYSNDVWGDSVQIDVADLLKTYDVGTISISSMYREMSPSDGWIYHSNNAATVAINYSIAGDSSPAQCLGLSIDGSDGNNSETIFFVGQQVTLSPIFSDPNGLPVMYRIIKGGNASWLGGEDTYITGFDQDQNNPYANSGWIQTAEEVIYVFKEEDNIEEFTLEIHCKNNDGIGENGSNSVDTFHRENINVMGI